MARSIANRISVPFHQGVDSYTEEFLLNPPYLKEARNVSYERRGGLKKRTGWDYVGSLSAVVKGPAVLPAQPDGSSVAVFDQRFKPGRRFYSGASSDMEYGPIPHEVKAHPVDASSGAVLMMQAAHSDGRTLVVASIARKSPLIGSDDWESLEAVVYMLDSDWNLVAGPFYESDLAFCPRVHVMKTGAGTDKFLILGVDIVNKDLYGSVLDVTSPPSSLSTTLIDGISLYQPSSGSFEDYILYDSYCSGENGEECHIAYYDGSNLLATRVDTSLSANNRTVHSQGLVGGTAPAGASFAIYHDTATETVLVHSEDQSAMYYADDTTGSFSSVSDTGSVNGDFPVFWTDDIDGLYLTDREITLSGSGPATPSYGSAGFFTPTYGRPVARQTGLGGGIFYSPHTEHVGTKIAAQALYAGGKALSINPSLSDNTTYGTSILGATLWDKAYPGTFYLFPGAGGGSSKYLGVIQQIAQDDDGNLLIPLFYPNSGYLAPALDPGDFLSPTAGSEEYKTLWGAAGPLDGAYQLVVTEIVLSEDHPKYSYIDHYGSTVAAMGSVVSFDGTRVVSLSTQDSLASTSWGSSKAGRYLNEAGKISNTINQPLANGDSIKIKPVLSYVDKNGVRYRWPVYSSDAVANSYHGNLAYERSTEIVRDNSSGGDEYLEYITLNLPPGLIPAAQTGNLSCEIYTTDTYSTVGTEETDFTFSIRAPVVWDSSNDEWLVDFIDILDVSQIDNPTSYPFDTELLPTSPPASNAIARAGNYVFLVPSENPYNLWASKPLGTYLGPEFSPELILAAPHDSGGIESIAGIGDYLYLLCRNGVWELFVGSGGPDAEGSGAFPEFRRVSSEGCSTARGTAVLEDGVAFMGVDYPKIVTSQGVTDIGSLIASDITPSDVVCAYYDPTTEELWFYFDANDSWIFDVRSSAWTSSQFQTLAAFTYKNNHARFTDQNKIVQKGTGTDDDGAGFGDDYILAKIVTPWLKLDSPVSYKRFRRLTSLFNFYTGSIGQGSINIKIAYNYQDTDVDTFTWTESLGAIPQTDLSSLDLSGNGTHLQARFSRQKVDAVRITIEETAAATSSESTGNTLQWILSALSLEVRAKVGDMKLQQEAKK